jgi:hypothetical protein
MHKDFTATKLVLGDVSRVLFVQDVTVKLRVSYQYIQHPTQFEKCKNISQGMLGK